MAHPTAIGRYEVRRVLAVGATSSVYLAHDPHLDVDVALKVLADHLVHRPEVVGQFLAQARTLRSITDRRVIAVHDIGTTTSGQPYFVMDLVTGGSLADRLRANEPLDLATRADLALRVGNDLAEGLAAVHRHGVVHGDVKPENVFIAGAGADHDAPADASVFPPGAHVVLGDLGGVDEEGGLLPGTPGYMAPEQVAGRAIDARADVYAATALTVRVLTGRPPSADGTVALGAATPQFGAFVAHGLAPDPADRPADIVEWASELRDTRRGRPWRIAAAVGAMLVLVVLVAAVVIRARGDDAQAVLVSGTSVIAVGSTSSGTTITDAESLGFDPAAAVPGDGDLIVIADADGNRVYTFDNDEQTVLAGTGVAGDGGDGGEATKAELNGPRAVAARDGAVAIADSANNRVRAVDDKGVIRTIAGTGATGSAGDGAAATAATIGNPIAVAYTSDGRVLVIGGGSNRVRVFEPGGTISAFAGTGTGGFAGDDGPATDAELRDPRALAVGSDDTVYIADSGNHRVRAVAPDGTITTLADLKTRTPSALATVGDTVIVSTDDGTVLRVEKNGTTAALDPI